MRRLYYATCENLSLPRNLSSRVPQGHPSVTLASRSITQSHLTRRLCSSIFQQATDPKVGIPNVAFMMAMLTIQFFSATVANDYHKNSGSDWWLKLGHGNDENTAEDGGIVGIPGLVLRDVFLCQTRMAYVDTLYSSRRHEGCGSGTSMTMRVL